MDYENGDNGEMEQEEEEMYTPLNWDSLAKNENVWMVMKEEMDKKFEAECLMKIITAAKDEGMKDDKIFLPKPKIKIEFVSLFDSSLDEDL